MSQPVQVTNDTYYERGQSIIYDGENYWLFYARSDSVTGNYQNPNPTDPDTHDYKIYYKKAPTIEGLASATPVLLSGSNVSHNSNIYQGETDAAYYVSSAAEVRVYAAVDMGDHADLYQFYTKDGGTTWKENVIVSGMPVGAAHFAVTTCDGKLWFAYRKGNNWETKYWSTTGGWTSGPTISGPQGTASFYCEGTDLYFARADAGNQEIYHWDGSSWALIDSSTETYAYDPTIFKKDGYYVFVYAPWDGTKQYLKAKVSSSLNTILSSPSHEVMITKGGYGTNYWVDMWPTAFTDASGNTYLFYTSERNPSDPLNEITGNIWYLKFDWNPEHDHYTYIQNAIDAAKDGDTIEVAAGTYNTEKLTIDKSLTLNGANAGIHAVTGSRASESIIDLSAFTGDGILVTADNVTIDGFTIVGIPYSGNSSSNVNPTIAAEANYTTVQNCVFNTSEGALGKEAMLVRPGFNNISFLNNEVNNYIFGITARGANYGGSATLPDDGVTDLTVSGNTFNVGFVDTGSSIIGEAVQIHYGDNIMVTNNTIHGPGTFESSTYGLINSIGIADFMSGYGAAGTITYSNNEVTNCYVGIATFAGNGEIRDNIVTGNNTGIQVGQNDDVYISTPATGVTITENDITNNKVGIDVQNFVPDGLTAHHNNIVGNTEYGVQNSDTDIFDAINNWWGDASGPYHATNNPSGAGDAVSDNVNFNPWLIAEYGSVSGSEYDDDGDSTVDTSNIPGMDSMTFSSNIPGEWVNINAYEGTPPQGSPSAIGFLGRYYDITSSLTPGTFTATIVFSYTDDELAAAGISEDDDLITVTYWDGSSWQPIDPSNIVWDKTNNTVTVTIDHFTPFSIIAAATIEVSDITPDTAKNGDDDVGILDIRIFNGAAFDDKLDSLTVRVRASELGDIEMLKIYKDRDNDGVFEPGADDGAPIRQRSIINPWGNKAVFNNLNQTIPAGTEQHFFIAFDIMASAFNGNTVDAWIKAGEAVMQNAGSNTVDLDPAGETTIVTNPEATINLYHDGTAQKLVVWGTAPEGTNYATILVYDVNNNLKYTYTPIVPDENNEYYYEIDISTYEKIKYNIVVEFYDPDDVLITTVADLFDDLFIIEIAVRVEAIEAEINSINDEIQDLWDANAQQWQQIQELRNQLNDLNSELTAMIDDVNAELQAKIADLQSQIDNLMEMLLRMNHGTINLYHDAQTNTLRIWGEAPEGANFFKVQVFDIYGTLHFEDTSTDINQNNEYEYFLTGLGNWDPIKYNIIVEFYYNDGVTDHYLGEVGALFDDLWMIELGWDYYGFEKDEIWNYIKEVCIDELGLGMNECTPRNFCDYVAGEYGENFFLLDMSFVEIAGIMNHLGIEDETHFNFIWDSCKQLAIDDLQKDVYGDAAMCEELEFEWPEEAPMRDSLFYLLELFSEEYSEGDISVGEACYFIEELKGEAMPYFGSVPIDDPELGDIFYKFLKCLGYDDVTYLNLFWNVCQEFKYGFWEINTTTYVTGYSGQEKEIPITYTLATVEGGEHTIHADVNGEDQIINIAELTPHTGNTLTGWITLSGPGDYNVYLWTEDESGSEIMYQSYEFVIRYEEIFDNGTINLQYNGAPVDILHIWGKTPEGTQYAEVVVTDSDGNPISGSPFAATVDTTTNEYEAFISTADWEPLKYNILVNFYDSEEDMISYVGDLFDNLYMMWIEGRVYYIEHTEIPRIDGEIQNLWDANAEQAQQIIELHAQLDDLNAELTAMINDLNAEMQAKVAELQAQIDELKDILNRISHGTFNIAFKQGLNEIWVWGEVPEGTAYFEIVVMDSQWQPTEYEPYEQTLNLEANEYEAYFDLNDWNAEKYTIMVYFYGSDNALLGFAGGLFDNLYILWIEERVYFIETVEIPRIDSEIQKLWDANAQQWQQIQELRNQLNDLNSELTAMIDDVNAELQAKIADLQSQIDNLMEMLLRMNHGTINLAYDHSSSYVRIWGEAPEGTATIYYYVLDDVGNYAVADTNVSEALMPETNQYEFDFYTTAWLSGTYTVFVWFEDSEGLSLDEVAESFEIPEYGFSNVSTSNRVETFFTHSATVPIDYCIRVPSTDIYVIVITDEDHTFTQTLRITTLNGNELYCFNDYIDFNSLGDWELYLELWSYEEEEGWFYQYGPITISVVDLASDTFIQDSTIMVTDPEPNAGDIYWTNQELVMVNAVLGENTPTKDNYCDVFYESNEYSGYTEYLSRLPVQDGEGAKYCQGYVRTSRLDSGTEGVYKLGVEAEFEMGVDAVDYFYIGYDITPPEIVEIVDPGFISGTVTLQANVTDDASGVAHVWMSIQDKGSEDLLWTGEAFYNSETGYYEVDFNSMQITIDGSYNIYVEATDVAGNTATGYIDPVIDNTNPVIESFVMSPNNPVRGEQLLFQARVSDNISGIQNVVMEIRDCNNNLHIIEVIRTSGNDMNGVYEGTIDTNNEFAACDYVAVITAKDRANNSADKNIEFTLAKGTEEEHDGESVIVWPETANVISAQYNDVNKYYNFWLDGNALQWVKVYMNNTWITLDVNIDGNSDLKAFPDKNIIVIIQKAKITSFYWDSSRKELNITADGNGLQEVVVFVNGNGKPNTVKFDGTEISDWDYNAETQTVRFTVNLGSPHTILLSWYTPPSTPTPTPTPRPPSGGGGGRPATTPTPTSEKEAEKTPEETASPTPAPEETTPEETPVETETPVVTPEETVEETPVPEESPVQEETPITEETPVASPTAPTGFFGLGAAGDVIGGVLIVIIIIGGAFYLKARAKK